jgi:hypothetical protein
MGIRFSTPPADFVVKLSPGSPSRRPVNSTKRALPPILAIDDSPDDLFFLTGPFLKAGPSFPPISELIAGDLSGSGVFPPECCQ